MSGSETMAARVARLEEWTEGHEARCTDRQVAMGREIRELKRGVGGLSKGAWAIALALLGFAGVQLYDGLKNHPMTAAVAVSTQSNPR